MNKMFNIIKKQQSDGFTLLEVVIAVAIFSIGVLGATALHGAATKNNLTGSVLTTAKSLAQDKLEELKASELPDNEVNAETLDDNFTRQWTISDLVLSDGSVSPFAKTVEVTVSWTKGSLTRSVTLTSTTRGSGL